MIKTSVTDPDPVSGVFFWPLDPGWVKSQYPGHISERLKQFSGIKYLKSFFWCGYGMEKFGSGIKDPGSATLIKTLNSVFLQEEMVKGLVGWLGHPLGPPIVVHCSAGKPNDDFLARLCFFLPLDHGGNNYKDTTSANCRLYCCNVYRLEIQSVMFVFSTPLCPSKLLTGSPSPLPLPCVNKYRSMYSYSVWRGEGIGLCGDLIQESLYWSFLRKADI
jgi:hypothetical protein